MRAITSIYEAIHSKFILELILDLVQDKFEHKVDPLNLTGVIALDLTSENALGSISEQRIDGLSSQFEYALLLRSSGLELLVDIFRRFSVELLPLFDVKNGFRSISEQRIDEL